MTTEATIRNFILETFLFGDTSVDLGDDVSLIESGIVDSTGVLELLGCVEKTWGVAISDTDIVPANFDTIGRIAAFVAARTGVSAAA